MRPETQDELKTGLRGCLAVGAVWIALVAAITLTLIVAVHLFVGLPID